MLYLLSNQREGNKMFQVIKNLLIDSTSSVMSAVMVVGLLAMFVG